MNKQMTKQKEQKTAMQTYRIEFGSDDRLYSVSFKAAIARPELYEMLAAARGSLYENFPEVIWAYLDSHCPENSDFASGASCLEHDNVMAAAGRLLYDGSCDILDQIAGGADAYYGIMDHQRRMDGNYCEGCYCAVSRTVSGQSGFSECHVIGQIFGCDAQRGMGESFFAIRKSMDGRQMYTLDQSDGYPVLGPFGCVDVAGLLVNIHSIVTKEEAARVANR